MKSRYVPGTYNVISDLSGFEYKRKDMMFTWNGLLVGKDEWEEKHPQLTIRAKSDRQSVPDARPPQESVTVDPFDVSTDAI